MTIEAVSFWIDFGRRLDHDCGGNVQDQMEVAVPYQTSVNPGEPTGRSGTTYGNDFLPVRLSYINLRRDFETTMLTRPTCPPKNIGNVSPHQRDWCTVLTWTPMYLNKNQILGIYWLSLEELGTGGT